MVEDIHNEFLKDMTCSTIQELHQMKPHVFMYYKNKLRKSSASPVYLILLTEFFSNIKIRFRVQVCDYG